MIVATNQLSHLQAMVNLAKSKDSESEAVFIINNITWNQYESLLNFLGDDTFVKLKYCQENLAIMSPSRRHEFYKSILGMLLEAYFFAKKIRFYSWGSTTLKNQLLNRGIEPDESYCLYSNKEIPDLAIEIIVTSGGFDSLEIYRGLGVKEVWFWEKERLSIYVLNNDIYVKVNRSSLLPDLDVDLLANYIIWDEPFDAVLEFKKQIEES